VNETGPVCKAFFPDSLVYYFKQTQCNLAVPGIRLGRGWMINNQEKRKAEVLDGAPLAEEVKREVTRAIAEMRERYGTVPTLVVVQVGDDPASAVYVRNKMRACEAVGMRSEQHALPATTSGAELLALVDSLNTRDDVDGILVQLPLPSQIDETTVIEAVDPGKDVDGFHPINVGRLARGQKGLVPCTPAGIMELLDRYKVPLSGANACVIGRSQIVGRPVAQLLLQRDATVTICHSKTPNLDAVTSQGDILIVAIGRPGFVGHEHIKPGATVIDVGMNKISDENEVRRLFGSDAAPRLQALAKRGYTLVGDVHPAEADAIAGRLTPVPGGVGLLTVAMLMRNTLKAARLRRALD
jgi:methylenetetrahydrofolate dehydrogenase (NADP+)/methenyltetrahydrofolate cyclohydrolase